MDAQHVAVEAGSGSALLDGWLSRAGLAAELGISVDTLARWETRRIGPPCVRIGRKVHYRAAAIREWLISQERRKAGQK
jgi:predicted DNA-binding transcriptional regulator AlpA